MKEFARNQPVVAYVVVAVAAFFCGVVGHKISQKIAKLDVLPNGTYYLKTEAVPRAQYESAQADMERYRSQLSIPIADLPSPIGVPLSPRMSLLRIQKLMDAVELIHSSGLAFAHVAAEVANNSKIDTKIPSSTPPRTMLYKHLQQVMNVINAQKVPVNGEQKDTFQAVAAFQKECGSQADGVIGAGTWKIVAKRYAVALLGGTSGPSAQPDRSAGGPPVSPPGRSGMRR